tara:strand:- start:4063 stop:4350 length:288 start_codon:yes stop_codon:yes gene_type:complete
MEYLAYVGGCLLGIQLFPQIYKVLITKSVNDISIPYLIMNIMGLSCIVSYAIVNKDPPIYIPASISTCNTTFLLMLVLHYKQTNAITEEISEINI